MEVYKRTCILDEIRTFQPYRKKLQASHNHNPGCYLNGRYTILSNHTTNRTRTQNKKLLMIMMGLNDLLLKHKLLYSKPKLAIAILNELLEHYVSKKLFTLKEESSLRRIRIYQSSKS